MRAIVNTGPNQLELRELPVPDPAVGQVRIRTAACGICATDLRMISGWDRTGCPSIPGHEWAGIVDAVGTGADPEWVGRRCVGENVLSDGGEVGFEHPGAYAEYFVTEADKLHFLTVDYPPVQATLIEPLAVCVRGMKRLHLEDRSSAIIFGDGPIGLIMLWLLRQNNVEHIVQVGGRDTRLKLAGEIGADMILNYHELHNDLVAEVLGKFPSGFSNVVEASGSESAMHACTHVAQNKGRILVMGEYGQARVDFPANQLLVRELELIGSNASEGAWDDALQLVAQGSIPFSKLVSCTVPAEEFEKGVDLALNSREMIKVVMEWLDDKSING